MRIFRRAALLCGFLAGLSLMAQVEPELLTKTDLPDVYKSSGGIASMVAIYDFTPASRGMFETKYYLTQRSRDSAMNGPQGLTSAQMDSTIATLFAGNMAPTGAAKYLGYVFAARQNAAKTNISSTDVDVRLYPWPATNYTTVAPLKQSATDVIGALYYTDGSGVLQKAFWNTDAATTLSSPKNSSGTVQTTPVTHVRVRLTGASGVIRTIDLPVPWKLVSSPSTVSTSSPNYQQEKKNFGGVDVFYDPWSSDSANANTQDYGSGVNKDRVLGNFYYAPDYLAWIFGGKAIRNSNSSAWTTLSATTTDPFATPSALYPTSTKGYAIKDFSNDGISGWSNRLPVMTRYMAVKSASINVFFDRLNKVNWIYRFLAPWYPSGFGYPTSEEEGGSSASASATPSSEPGFDPATAATDPTKLRDLRVLTLADLKTNSSALQKKGPDTIKWNMTTTSPSTTTWAYDNGTFTSLDPVTPQPWSTALANTYRMIWKARQDAALSTALFGAQNATCPAEVFVVPFMNLGPNDSLSAALDQGASYTTPNKGYRPYYSGNTNLNGGSYVYNAALPDILPSSTSLGEFHPGVLSAVAAHSPALANNAAKWGAPWVTGGKSLGVSTRVVSLAVPGAMRLGSDNNGRNPHEQMFAVAQWGDKKTPTWSKSNASPAAHDTSVTEGGSVYYYPSADPQQLQKNLGDLVGSIVSASGALSAPATPATGVQNATQAYFGTFVTNPRNDLTAAPAVWSGNLYAIGLDRTTGFFQFYGNQAGTTFPLPLGSVINTTATTDAFDRNNLWSAYKVFNRYQNANSFYTVNYAADASNTGVWSSPGGTGLSWKDRRIFIVNSSGSLEQLKYTYASSNNPDAFDATQLATLKGYVNSGTKVVGGPTVQRITLDAAGDTNLKAMLRWLMGAFDPTHTTVTTSNTGGTTSNAYTADMNRDGDDVTVASASPVKGSAGHVNLFGDVINSAPLTVELSKDLAETIVLPWGTSLSGTTQFTTAYDTSKAYDPHTRLVIVGTNTGTLHCFVEVAYQPIASVSASGAYVLQPIIAKATELWGFIPPNLMPILWDMYQDDVNGVSTDIQPHRYAVDGDPVLIWKDQPRANSVVGDTRVSKNEGEAAVVVFGMRKGSRDYYGIQISNGEDTDILPHKPKLAFRVDALGSQIIHKDGTTTSDTMIKKLGLGTAVPALATVSDDSGNRQNVVFISGGYANPQVEANYQYKYDATGYAAGTSTWRTGRLILALDPLSGKNILSTKPGWDFSDESTYANMGSIPGGVTPLVVTNAVSGLAQRLYFADMRGNIWAINSKNKATNDKFRSDSSMISTWDAPRALISNLEKERFTNAPDAFRLPGDYPLALDDGDGKTVRPVTVMVTVGSGDRNNPIDGDESFTKLNDATKTTTASAPTLNRFYVVADLQNQSSPWDIDSELQLIDASWASGKTCIDSPIQEAFDPTSSNYLWKKKRGYYYQMSDTTGYHPFADPLNSNKTFDKMLVSPLVKEGGIFFSYFSVDNNSGTGYNCSAFAQTRTYRICDVLRPMYYDPRVALTSVVNKDNKTTRNDLCSENGGDATKACSGLAFAFYSLSSQLVDTGDYVMQGGAKSTETSAGSKTYTENRPDIQSVKNTGNPPGFRVKSWRVIR